MLERKRENDVSKKRIEIMNRDMKQQLDQNFQTRKPLNKTDNDKKIQKGKGQK